MRPFVVALTAGLFAAAPAIADATCTHQLKTAKPGWKAYKTTDKLPVGGTFSKATLSPTAPAASVPEALAGATMNIVASSVDSGLDIRNQTLVTSYFSKLLPDAPFRVSVAKVEGDNSSGTATLNVELNGVSRAMAFPYTVSEAGELTAVATMEMMDFGLKAAFDAIHTACEALHTGPDGVSKTWTDVELTVNATIEKSCN